MTLPPAYPQDLGVTAYPDMLPMAYGETSIGTALPGAYGGVNLDQLLQPDAAGSVFDPFASAPRFTTFDGSTLSVAPGDLIGRVEPVAGTMDLVQPTSGSRWQLAVRPRDGIRNRLSNNMMVGAVVGAPGTRPTSWVFGTAGLEPNIAAVTPGDGYVDLDIEFNGTPSATSAQTITFAPNITISAGETWTTSGYFQLVSGGLTNVSAFSLRLADEVGVTVFTPDGTLTRQVNTRTATGTTASAKLRWNYVDTSTPVNFVLRIRLVQLEKAAAVSDPQQVRALWDVTETGIPSVQSQYFNGSTWGTFGQGYIGTDTDANLSASAGNDWYARVVFRILANGTILAQCGATDVSRMFELYIASGLLRLRLKGTDNDSGVTVTLGLFCIAQINCTDGSVTMSVNGGAHAAMTAGAEADETQNITFMCRTQSSPANIATGNAPPPTLINRALSVQEMAQDYAWCKANLGVA